LCFGNEIMFADKSRWLTLKMVDQIPPRMPTCPTQMRYFASMAQGISKLKMDVTDDAFNAIFPPSVQSLSRKHWTPIAVAKTAAEFLVRQSGDKVLDIGSGAGKFCLIGGSTTSGHFTGVEQRGDLVETSRALARQHEVVNTTFIHANITTIDFLMYDAFYFFNSFHENIDIHHKIDSTVPLDLEHYDTYSLYLIDQLSKVHAGRRLATYCSSSEIVPPCFQLVSSLYAGRLNLWEKIH
jgi:SAM-dependent methyltransferase